MLEHPDAACRIFPQPSISLFLFLYFFYAIFMCNIIHLFIIDGRIGFHRMARTHPMLYL